MKNSVKCFIAFIIGAPLGILLGAIVPYVTAGVLAPELLGDGQFGMIFLCTLPVGAICVPILIGAGFSAMGQPLPAEDSNGLIICSVLIGIPLSIVSFYPSMAALLVVETLAKQLAQIPNLLLPTNLLIFLLSGCVLYLYRRKRKTT